MEQTIFISPQGNDITGDGSKINPFATPHKGVAAGRMGENPCTLQIESGVYFCETPVELTAQDSGMTLLGGENTVLTGAQTVGKLHWEKVNDGIWRANLECNPFDRMFADGAEQTLCRFPNRRVGEVPLEGAATPGEIKKRVPGYQNPAGGFVRAIHQAEWGGNSYLIEGKDITSSCGLALRWVGDNNRGSKYGNALVVENVQEELDEPGEWFYHTEQKALYWYPPESVAPNSAVIAVSTATELLTIRGEDVTCPAAQIVIKNITFSHTGHTLFPIRVDSKPYVTLLRGDWCVVRSGAVVMQNAANCEISGCRFSSLGGNGLFLSGYQTKHHITGNQFDGIAASAIQAVGDPSAVRQPSFWPHELYPELAVHQTVVEESGATGPCGEAYPRDLIISGNHINGVGLLEKQSAGINLSICSRIHIIYNTIHNSARSLINVNDGTFGGHEIAHNDLYDAQRETADHGPFNSWGRDRFWSVPQYNASGKWGGQLRAYEKDGVTSDITKIDAYQTTRIHHNRFHHSPTATHSWGIDLDDGSTNYEIDHNLVLGIGIKLREGFDRLVHHNLLVDGQLQIHVPYEGCNDRIQDNLILHCRPVETAVCNAKRFRASGILMEGNAAFANGKAIQIAKFFPKLKTDLPIIPVAFGQGFPQLPAEWQSMITAAYGRPGCTCQSPDYEPTYGSAGQSAGFWLWGIKCCEVTEAIRSSTAMADCSGIYVQKMLPFSKAKRMGILPGDVLREADGAPIAGKLKRRPTQLTVWRGSQMVVLGK